MMKITTVFLDHNENKQEAETDCKIGELATTIYTLIQAHLSLKHQIISITVEQESN